MAIDFPNSPTVNDTFTAAGRTWTYSGSAWFLKGAASSAELSTTLLDGGTPSTIQFNVMGAVNAGGV